MDKNQSASSSDYILVLSIDDLPANTQKVVQVGAIKIALFNVNGEITALGNTCIHKGGPIGEGKLKTKKDGNLYVVCPWHGWEYSVKTGKAPGGYEDQLPVFDVKVDSGKIYVTKFPVVKPVISHHKDNPLKDLANLEYQTTPTSLNILGISCTNMHKRLTRTSTSERALEKALEASQMEFGAVTKMLKLRELEFRNCEGYYSQHEQACTWPCSISEMAPNDGMNEVYRGMVLWADVVLVATPIRWGNACSLYYKMVERLNCVQNQITLQDKILIKNKVAGFIITGGQDNIQSVAGQMMVFFTELGFALPPFCFMGWSRGWIAEDMDRNVKLFTKSQYVNRSVHDLVENCVRLNRQLKSEGIEKMNSTLPKIAESPSKTAEQLGLIV